MNDSFGDRMKGYERQETGRRFMPLLPVYARIDGRSFSAFTRGLQRPYDEQFTRLMIETTKYLVKETGAVIGYTQSDEISLAWYTDKPDSQIFFDGKIFKMTSILAAMATAFFNKELANYLPSKTDKTPMFDCRIFQLPTLIEATNAFLWREQDATKNAVSMAARSMFSHKELHGKSGNEMQEMMWQEHDINFNDYPAFFKRGTFVRQETIMRDLTAEELSRIPVDRRPSGPVMRSHVVELEMPKFSSVTNRVGVIFNQEQPEVANASD